MKKSNGSRKNLFFSLVEILVVITIISLLAGILMPGLMKSRKHALSKNCISNLRQLGIAVKIYNQDYGYYPDAYVNYDGKEKYWCAEFNGNNSDFYKSPLAEYIKIPALLICPAFTDFTSKDPSKKAVCSYGINVEFAGGKPSPGANVTQILNNPPPLTDEVKRPDRMILFADAAEDASGLTESYFIWARFSYEMGFELEATAHFRHDNKNAAVFCDGHCEDTLKPDAIKNENLKLGWLEQDLIQVY
ncbi:MAG TPA: type II secretion system protein [Victivallales bacterium]|nr:type II secretion system protein [Victivallales bacterium]HPO90602.1 type II secretion system protein [Victivallales bacterium]HRR28253.1 type II secretion system protein [Victivallales bacterium]HRU00125.1 type II secretion system protein [Victivallales bacterium]